MIDIAQGKDEAKLVEWLWGDFRAIADREVDLIVMVGNIPSIYVTDDIWESVLGVLHGALRPGGHLAFGSWNPAVRRWERWGNDVVLLVGAEGSRAVVNTDERLVPGPSPRPGAFSGIELAEGRELLGAGSEWRYRSHEELSGSLTRSGFVVNKTYGDWDRSPLAPDSPEIVIVARRT